MKSWDHGRSMIEMLGVLAIVGILSIGGISGYSKAMMQYRINKTIEHILEMSTKLSTFGQRGNSYEGLNAAGAIKYKAVPSSTVRTNSSLENVFGGDIVISSASITGGVDDNLDNMAYIITFKDISADACLALAIHDWGYKKNSSFIGIKIGTVTENDGFKTSCVKSSKVACAADNEPMAVTKAAAACDCEQNCIFTIKYR